MTTRAMRRPTWTLKLSNKGLVDEFSAIWETANKAAETRLEILHAEIRRRQEAGTMNDDDWKPND